MNTFLPLFYFIFLYVAGDGASVMVPQCTALLNLKHGFSSSSSLLPSWIPGTDCCHWEGIACNSSGEIIALDLSNRAISGDLSPALFTLASLQSLNLSYNLFGPKTILPLSGFENLVELTHLNLSNSGFVGQVPIGIARLEKLVSLDLSTFVLDVLPGASLKLEDPDLRTLVGGLPGLRQLFLDGVNISTNGAEWGRAISESLSGLVELSLSGCYLTGPIDESLANLGNLSLLHLDQNDLASGVPEFFGNFSSLRYLRLSLCQLRGEFPNSVFEIPNLKLLDLSNNPMLSGRLSEFPRDSALQSLVLSYTNFSGNLPDSIGNLRNLTNLQLTNCSFSGLIPPSIGNLTQLVNLDISFNGFTGPIPSFAPTSMLLKAILSNNLLTGTIPDSFRDSNGGFQSLSKLDLSCNFLTGFIPISLFSLPALQSLSLSQNELSGDLVKLEQSKISSSLVTVDLSYNMLQGQILNSILAMPGLKILSLASNNFSGAIDLNWIGRLENLSSLDLSRNNLSVFDSEYIGNFSLLFPSITALKLVSCNLTKIPSFLRFKTNMNSLDLSENKIQGEIPDWIWNIGNYSLTYLNLSCNSFSRIENWDIPDHFSSPLVLDLHSNMLEGPVPLPPANNIVVDYSFNIFSSSIPPEISLYMNFTVFFSLSGNNITGEIRPSICNASYLQVLDLSYNALTGSIPSCLVEVASDIVVLNLAGNQLQGTLPKNFGAQCGLQTINLSGNKLEGQIPLSLENCSNLVVLDLGNNQMNGMFPFWLGSLNFLRVLVLRSNKFSGQLGGEAHAGFPSGNYTFPALQIFDISSNGFSGVLPSDRFENLTAMRTVLNPKLNHQGVGFRYLLYTPSYYQDSVTIIFKGLQMTLEKTLTIFTSIDFSNNLFEGKIPVVIGDLKSLYLLNLSRNSLSGEIPTGFGNLNQLESLDLSFNTLSGVIPESLTLLTFLSFLNLSYNYLTGAIPQTQQFSTFGVNSFEGNTELCGSPVPLQCATNSPNHSFFKPTIAPSKQMADAKWVFIFTGIGVGGGAAMVVGTLTMWETVRIWYFERVDRLFFYVVAIFWVAENCGDAKVDADYDDDDMDEVEVDGRLQMHFCLFCTQLEFWEGKMCILHKECTCSSKKSMTTTTR